MILDCFMFFNELDLLEGRLEYLYNTVDYFVIVESNITHGGESKPLRYLENIDRYHKYSKKIIYMPLAIDASQYDFSTRPASMDASTDHWKIDALQRSHIINALKFFPKDTLVILSDLDEIPSLSAIELAKNIVGNVGPCVSLEQQMFYYNFKQRSSHLWYASTISVNEFLQEMSIKWVRENAFGRIYPTIFNGGWHLSFWGSPTDISYKIRSSTHQEFNKEEFTSIEKIKERVNAGRDPFDEQQIIQVDSSEIPDDVLRIFGKYELRI